MELDQLEALLEDRGIIIKREDFYRFRDKCFKNKDCDTCFFGQTTGGPGYLGFEKCMHDDHQDVRLGGKRCPDSCNDFILDEPAVCKLYYYKCLDQVNNDKE